MTHYKARLLSGSLTFVSPGTGKIHAVDARWPHAAMCGRTLPTGTQAHPSRVLATDKLCGRCLASLRTYESKYVQFEMEGGGTMKINPFINYILDEQDEPVPEPDWLKWAAWHQKAERHVGDTSFGDIRVSTVFLSTPCPSKEPGNDEYMLYETMVFADEAILKRLSELGETDDRSIMILAISALSGKERWDIQKRYATKAEALEGHKNMCIFIETCLTKGLLPETEEAREP